MSMNSSRSASSSAAENQSNSGGNPHGNVRLHYLAGAITLSLLLFFVYAFFFEDQAPPHLLGRQIEEPRKIEMSDAPPVIVIEDVDFGKSPADGEEVPQNAVVPEKASENDETRTEKVASESRLPAAPLQAPVPTPETAEPDPAEDSAAMLGTVSPEGSPPPSPSPAEEPAGNIVAGNFVVQIIATRDPGNAEKIASKIAAEGLRSYVESLERESQELYRVRVGPFRSRSEAELAKQDLRVMGHEDSVIIDLR